MNNNFACVIRLAWGNKSPGWDVNEIRFMILRSQMILSFQSTDFCRSSAIVLYDSFLVRDYPAP